MKWNHFTFHFSSVALHFTSFNFTCDSLIKIGVNFTFWNERARERGKRREERRRGDTSAGTVERGRDSFLRGSKKGIPVWVDRNRQKTIENRKRKRVEI